MKGTERTAGLSASNSARDYPRSRIALYTVVGLGGCVADLATKFWVFRWLGEPGTRAAPKDHTWWLVEGYFGFQTAVNTGALFGMGQGGSLWFAAISIVAAVTVVVWLFLFGAARDLFLTFALGCVSGGILGNLYDRLGLWDNQFAAHRHGVRDWILMQVPDYPPWPNYNIADCLLVCGAAMLVWHAFWYREDESSPTRTTGPRQPNRRPASPH